MLQRLWLLGVMVGSSVVASIAQAAPLQVCLDTNFNAPFVYAEKIKGAGKMRGYSLDLLKKIMAQTKRQYTLISMSASEIDTKLQDTKANAGCDIVLDVAKDAALAKSLLLTPPIYSLSYDLFYNWETYMTGLGVKALADVNQFKLCGVKNTDYGTLSKTLKIHTFNSIKDVVFNVKSKECDVFVAEGVSMRYGQRANQYQVPPVGCIRLAGTEKTYHIGVAKHVVGATTLVSHIQQALAALSTETTELAEKYDVNPTSCQQTLNIR